MGIDISPEQLVTLNEEHDFRVVTREEMNPTYGDVGELRVSFIFARRKFHGDEGDGNPLIYALKDLKGFSISDVSRAQFRNRTREIIAKLFFDPAPDFVLPIPSRYSICADFCDDLSSVVGCPVLSPSFVRKKTVGEVLSEPRAVTNGSRAKRALNRQLSIWEGMNPQAPLSMKDVDTKIRTLFEPFVFDGELPDLDGKSVLVADDLFSSGASIISVTNLLRSAGSTVSATCLFSGL